MGVTCVSKVFSDEDASMGFETLMSLPLSVTRINAALWSDVKEIFVFT